MSTIRMILPLVVIIILVVELPILQIYLSRRKSKWLGLIMPIIFIILSIIHVSGLTFPHGETVNQKIVSCVTVFILYNIPTIFLFGIYFPFRQDFKKKRDTKQI